MTAETVPGDLDYSDDGLEGLAEEAVTLQYSLSSIDVSKVCGF